MTDIYKSECERLDKKYESLIIVASRLRAGLETIANHSVEGQAGNGKEG